MLAVKKGFTLIELLIVVAIIAILAAIAVPNFLEAQTRSKVSRAKADLRSLVVALESYAVDNNSYPYILSRPKASDDFWKSRRFLCFGGFPFVNNNVPDKPGSLTTPIAYMSKTPRDPFDNYRGANEFIIPLRYERAGFGYDDGIRETAGSGEGVYINVPNDANGGLLGDGPDDNHYDYFRDPNHTPRRYVLWSVGPYYESIFAVPDDSNYTSRYNINNRYDPTNGTMSNGRILYFPGGESFP